ncbi:MAG: AAA family ATPase [Lachnospiraceae bacterium]|nr:AAA family ATPase [Lachnospiraceae bacterium]
MKIRELRIGHFGKLHNMTVRLDDGLNLIYGENESGKSTLHAFIGAMLFGLDRNRGRAGRDDLYVRYQPWDTPGAYQGSMDFEHEGREYRITRVFYQKEKSCVLTDLETGRKLPLSDDSITSLIPQLTKTAYYNTVSMGQLNLRCSEDFAGEVRNHIANLAMTGGCRLNVEGALDELYSRKKALGGELKKLDIEAIKAKERELLEKEKEAAALLERRDANIEQAKPVREEIERLKSLIPETAALKGEWEQARAAADAALAEKRAAEKKLKGIGLGLFMAGGVLCIAANNRSAVLIGIGIVLLMASIVVLFAAYISGRNEVSGESAAEASERFEEALEKRERISAEILRLDETADAYEAAADRLEWELENLGDIGNELDVCKQELMDAGQKEREIQKELEAVTLAADSIREISEGLRDSFSASFNELLSEEICLATDGRYSSGRVDQNLDIEVMGGLDHVPAESLSAGTMQQLFAALRFASARLFFGDIKIPILLDECFAYSDEQRMRSALSALADREGQQMLLFTCRKDEKAILDELGAAYSYIELGGQSV